MKGKNPKHQRRQGYGVTKGSGYNNSGTPNGKSNGKTNYAGKTPPVTHMPKGDADATYPY